MDQNVFCFLFILFFIHLVLYCFKVQVARSPRMAGGSNLFTAAASCEEKRGEKGYLLLRNGTEERPEMCRGKPSQFSRSDCVFELVQVFSPAWFSRSRRGLGGA